MVAINVLSLLLTIKLVGADWIDPDTPQNAFLTYALSPHPRGIPHRQEEKTNHTKHHKWWKTPAPTVSASPSASPSFSPSAYPTGGPREYELVFSDEFNTPGRTFEDGADPRWTALEKNDYTNDALHYYTVENVATNEHGDLVIISEANDTEVVGFNDVKGKPERITKHFRSGMVQSWNKFCFTGGIVEAEVVLPGKPDVGGLWPAFWLLGNMARHTYVGSSQHMWPWSSSVCTEKSRNAQLISGCDNVAHYGLQAHMGRGAPEIDIFEVQPGGTKANTGVFLRTPVGQPFMSSSFQVAPGLPDNRPGGGYWPGPGQWYEGLTGGNQTAPNIMFYGNYNHFRGDPPEKDYWSDAISYNRQLNESHFAKPHTYRLEWEVPNNDTGRHGYLHWFLDGDLVLAMNGTGIHKAGTGSEISSEPMYLLMNTAISSQWGFPEECPSNCDCKKFDCSPTAPWAVKCGFSDGFCDMMNNKTHKPQYRMNWVRVYQDPNDELQKVGCSTPERPTRKYIEAHERTYKQVGQAHPLLPVQAGGGTCKPGATGIKRESCGGSERGTCTSRKVCSCLANWTGPHCLAHNGFNSIDYDEPDTMSDIGFRAPGVVPLALLVGLGVLILLLFVTVRLRERLDGYKVIPEVDMKVHNLRG
jgi:beta-glucanase (GH16 family)